MNIYRAYQCPFFFKQAYGKQQQGARGVKCEAGEILFPNFRAAEDHKTAFCANECGWRRCSIAITLLKHYEREEERGNNGKPSGSIKKK
jgi:hypothetical protein